MTGHSRPTRFGLIRHAQTEWNLLKLIQGIGDSPLTREGEAAAKVWAERLSEISWDRILCSDLKRARATAEILNRRLALPIEFDERLREQDWGLWTGKTIQQIRREEPGRIEAQEAAGWGFRPPEGENRIDVCGRGMQTLREAGARYPGQTILVVTHEGIIKCLLNHLCGHGFGPEKPLPIKSYYLHWLIFDNGECSCEAANAMPLDYR